MTEVVICDTNAVIQLAIICPACFEKQSHASINFVVHSIVRQEIFALKKSPQKKHRLKPVFDFILKNVPHDLAHHLPNLREEEQFHTRLMRFEDALPPDMISAGSSRNDRKLLILAKTNNAHLLTNERTLYNLGKALLKDQEVWRVGDAIEKLVSLGLVTKKEIQSGLSLLRNHGECLSTECAKKLRQLGYTVKHL